MTSRHRTLGSLAPSTSFINESTYSACNPSWTQTGGPFYNVRFGTDKTMDDVVVPGFNRRRRSGEIFFNPMSRMTRTFGTSGGLGFWHRANTGILCSGSTVYPENRQNSDTLSRLSYLLLTTIDTTNGCVLPVPTIIDSESVSSLVTEASTSVLASRGKNMDTNLFESLAQADKSLRLVADLSSNIRKTLIGKSLVDKSKGFASAYLLYRYGLKPLVNDLSTVLLGIETKVAKVRRSSRTKRAINRRFSEMKSTSGLLVQSVNFHYSDYVEARAVSLDEFVATQLTESGITMKGLLSTPWELVPYSFVVDWFANVGDYINALIPAPYYTMLGSCVVVDRSTTIDCFAAGTSSTTFNVIRPVSGSIHGEIHSTQRIPGLVRGFTVKSDFRFRNLTRASDAIALLVQRLKSA